MGLRPSFAICCSAYAPRRRRHTAGSSAGTFSPAWPRNVPSALERAGVRADRAEPDDPDVASVRNLDVAREVTGNDEVLVPAEVGGDFDRRTAPSGTGSRTRASCSRRCVRRAGGSRTSASRGSFPSRPDRPYRTKAHRPVRSHGCDAARIAFHPGAVLVADPERLERRREGGRIDQAYGRTLRMPRRGTRPQASSPQGSSSSTGALWSSSWRIARTWTYQGLLVSATASASRCRSSLLILGRGGGPERSVIRGDPLPVLKTTEETTRAWPVEGSLGSDRVD